MGRRFAHNSRFIQPSCVHSQIPTVSTIIRYNLRFPRVIYTYVTTVQIQSREITFLMNFFLALSYLDIELSVKLKLFQILIRLIRTIMLLWTYDAMRS